MGYLGKKRAWMLVAAAAVIWGTMGIWVRGLYEYGLGTMDIVALRSIGTSIVMGAGLFCRARDRLRVRKEDFWCFLGTGIASILFFNTCYFQSIRMIDLSTAAVLLYTSPIFVVLLSAVFFGERLTWHKCSAAAMAVAGCAMVSGFGTGEGNLNVAGILIGLGAGLGYALYSIFSRFALERGYETLTITFYTFLVAGICMLSRFLSGGVIRAAALSSAEFWLLSAGLVIIVTVAAYVLYTSGLSQMENTRAAVIATLEPVTASLIGVFLYQEPMGKGKLAGILIVLFSGWLVSRD